MNEKELPTLLATCTDIQVDDMGVKFVFGEVFHADDVEMNYHTSVFLPMSYVPFFESHYKRSVSNYIEDKAAKEPKKPKKKKNAV